MPDSLDRAAQQHLVDAISPWHHSIDLGDGVVTPGGKTQRADVIVDDFMTMDLAPLATFDVVLCLGVIYHLEEVPSRRWGPAFAGPEIIIATPGPCP